MKLDNLTTEARAKVTWGQPASSVRSFLTRNGIPEIEADAKIKELQGERNTAIRKIGTKKALVGAALTIVAGMFLYFSLRFADLDKMNFRAAKGFAIIAIVIALGGFYGLSRFIDGIIYFVRPQSVEKSIAEM